MKIKERLSYANVTATLALVAALATGGAYAQSRIGTSDIQNRAVTSKKVKKGTIRNANIRRSAITGTRIREGTLNALQFSALNGSQAGPCTVPDGSLTNCATTMLDLASRGRVLVIASGGAFSQGSPASGTCDITVNGGDIGDVPERPGETSQVNTSTLATNGFARTLVTPVLAPGPKTFSLACEGSGTDFRLNTATVSAIALTTGR